MTKAREYLCVLKQALVVNLHNINIHIIKGGYQTWSYRKGFFFIVRFFYLCNNTAISNSNAYKQGNRSVSRDP